MEYLLLAWMAVVFVFWCFVALMVWGLSDDDGTGDE